MAHSLKLQMHTSDHLQDTSEYPKTKLLISIPWPLRCLPPKSLTNERIAHYYPNCPVKNLRVVFDLSLSQTPHIQSIGKAGSEHDLNTCVWIEWINIWTSKHVQPLCARSRNWKITPSSPKIQPMAFILHMHFKELRGYETCNIDAEI